MDNLIYSPKAPITAIFRYTNALLTSQFIDIFAVGVDGQIWNCGARCTNDVLQPWDSKTPEPWDSPRRVSTVVSDGGTPIGALSRNASQIDLFVTGRDGRVYNPWWSG